MSSMLRRIQILILLLVTAALAACSPGGFLSPRPVQPIDRYRAKVSRPLISDAGDSAAEREVADATVPQPTESEPAR